MTEDALRYRRDTDGDVVYSVASDGTDDDGDFGALSPYSIWWQVTPDQSPDWGTGFACQTKPRAEREPAASSL